jgi:ribosomal protein S18 acetylase RimI-like enzyme
MTIMIRRMEEQDIGLIYATPAVTGTRRPPDLYDKYFREQESGERVVLLAFYDGEFTGHVSVVWNSAYPPFRAKSIPEIKDLVVHTGFLHRRIASAMMDEAERLIFERSPVAGIGVGMYSGYGPAQIMYARRGYVPDGRGLMHHEKAVVPMETVMVDDDLVLYLVKERQSD